jgi:signal transduction histidine kinase
MQIINVKNNLKKSEVDDMKNRLSRFTQTYFAQDLDLRVRLFNVLVLASTIFCVAIGAVNLFAGVGIVSVIVDLAAALFCYILLRCAGNGRVKVVICELIFIGGSFFILFPYLFFNMGGYHGGIPAFLVFAVVFTVFMLDGKLAVIVSVLELALYVGLYLCAFRFPDSVKSFPAEQGFFISNTMDLIVVGGALGATMLAQVRLYRSQQKKLDEQNTVLAEVNRAKTEFLSNTSHEMRTPLTVISVNVQTVTDILEDMGETVKDSDAEELLRNAQSEIMRLARMVGGMLTLASMSENTDKRPVELSELLESGTAMLQLSLRKRGNTLETEIEPELKAFGNADLLAQVASNLLQNAGAHTENGTIALQAAKSGREIAVTVRDTGEGIEPELLPRVFERGVTTDGTGFGLYLCKTVVESHGGRIWIESEPGQGTTATFVIPAYEGQLGGDEI